MGGIYGGGFYGNVAKRPYVHYEVQASIPCGPENVDKLTAALMDLIKTAQEKGPEQKDLDKVKETWKKQYESSLQNNEYWLNHLSQSFIDQTNPETILSYEQRVNALTTDDLKQAAQKYLDMKNYVKAVLYPETSTVKDQVKKSF